MALAPKAAALWPAVRLPIGQLHKPIAKSSVGVQFQKRDQASPLFGPRCGKYAACLVMRVALGPYYPMGSS